MTSGGNNFTLLFSGESTDQVPPNLRC